MQATPSMSTLYTPEERARRDRSPWTWVQGILAPLQFLVMLVSAALLFRLIATGEGAEWAGFSVLVKTGLLYLIMVTGSIWEKEVFGCWLFAKPFFWEDVVSMFVIFLHSAYLVGYFGGWGSEIELAWLALGAYAAYAVNALQFVWKLRMARLQDRAKGTLPLSGPMSAAGEAP